MNTKYNTGQADAIIVDEKAEAQMAMKTFMDSLFGENRI